MKKQLTELQIPRYKYNIIEDMRDDHACINTASKLKSLTKWNDWADLIITGIFIFSSDHEDNEKEEEPHCLKVSYHLLLQTMNYYSN